MKLDNDGNLLIDKIYRLDLSGRNEQLNSDSYGNLHFIWETGWDVKDIHYVKLDNDGNIIIEDKIIFSITSTPAFRMKTISSVDDNLHMVWGYNQIIHYAKLDTNGNILI